MRGCIGRRGGSEGYGNERGRGWWVRCGGSPHAVGGQLRGRTVEGERGLGGGAGGHNRIKKRGRKDEPEFCGGFAAVLVWCWGCVDLDLW